MSSFAPGACADLVCVGVCDCACANNGGRFGYFLFFFSVRGRGKRRRRPRRWLGGSVLIKNRGRGWGFRGESWEGEGRWGNVCGERGGAKYFFSGPKIPTKEQCWDDMVERLRPEGGDLRGGFRRVSDETKSEVRLIRIF